MGAIAPCSGGWGLPRLQVRRGELWAPSDASSSPCSEGSLRDCQPTTATGSGGWQNRRFPGTSEAVGVDFPEMKMAEVHGNSPE